ncbi:MAG: hypothetical protein JO055_12180 [Alphaproteobacteria bacterium]|nr:hypothetical protein [Alphaproteobacteria bacterium]
MAYMKNPPPKVVAQDKTKFHCWAASLESWIDARKPATPQASMTKTQAELISSYKDFLGAKDGLMVSKAMMQLMFDFQMMLDLYKPETKAITGQAIVNRLMMKSYLWLFYLGGSLGNFLGHAEVIYGVDGFGADANLRVMDPWEGKHNLLPLSDLNSRSTVFVCWYETSPTWSGDMFRIMKAMSNA